MQLTTKTAHCGNTHSALTNAQRKGTADGRSGCRNYSDCRLSHYLLIYLFAEQVRAGGANWDTAQWRPSAQVLSRRRRRNWIPYVRAQPLSPLCFIFFLATSKRKTHPTNGLMQLWIFYL